MIYGSSRGHVDAADVSEHYPWPERGGAAYVRAMMVGGLDGAAAGSDGLSGSISGDADRAVFDAVRRFADAVLVGGGTLSSEGYGALRARADDAERRTAQGQAPAPAIAVVSGSLDLPLGEDGFTGSTVRPLVFTHAGADPARVAALRERCEVVQSDGDAVTAGWVVDQLAGRGLWRIVCEGGPSLLRDVAESGRLDEVDLTYSPVLAGTERTPSTAMLATPRRFALEHLLTADGFVMARYLAEDA